MTTYTMNGHGDPARQVQPEILMGIVGNQAAQFKRTRWRLRTQPEKYSCLESPEPRVQLQGALKQIDELLKRNMQLLEVVFMLGKALGDAHALIYEDQSISQADQDKLRLSHDVHGYIKQLDAEIRQQMSR